jgi:hypothetical protein
LEGDEYSDNDEAHGCIGHHIADEEADDDDALVHGDVPGELGVEVECAA